MVQITHKEYKIRIFCDSASIQDMHDYASNPMVTGFTSNPTLAKNAGISNYLDFAKAAATACGEKEVSIEVIADENSEMIRQAALLSKIAGNISVKIPVTNSHGISTSSVVEELVKEGTRVNVTAVFSVKQATDMLKALSPASNGILSIFAGRIADTGIDPIPHVQEIIKLRNELAPSISLLWASPREPLNFIHAVASGSDIITMTPTLIQKVAAFGKDLEVFSLETVQMFTRDAKDSGFSL